MPSIALVKKTNLRPEEALTTIVDVDESLSLFFWLHTSVEASRSTQYREHKTQLHGTRSWRLSITVL